MPIYEYDCSDCGERVELLIRNQEETPVCPECGGTRLEKAFSVFAARSGRAGGDAPPAPA